MGFSLGEIFLLVIVGIVVVGPKRLPVLMRTAGQWVARLRRMSMDLRSQSGIDDLLRQEGLTQHINELRSLSRFNVVETLMAPTAAGAPARPPLDTPARLPPRASLPRPTTWKPEPPLREREYPLLGCDAYGCLPDSAVIYVPDHRGHDGAETPPDPSPTGTDLPAAAEPPAAASSDTPPATEPATSEPAASEHAASEHTATERPATEPAATEAATPAPAPGPAAAEVPS